MFVLNRLTKEPILAPVPGHDWESRAVFNAGIAMKDGKVAMLYRACDNAFVLDSERPLPENKFTSAIGYAESADGIRFARRPQPVMRGEGIQEDWGVEDPRITQIDGKYYMVYTAFGGRDWMDFRMCMAESDDLLSWGNRRVLLDEPNKDGGLLPEKVGGRYVLFHRRMPSIWVGFSNDLAGWTDHRVVLAPREGKWDSLKVGICGVPHKTSEGYLLFYHGVDHQKVYRLGACLLDLSDPSRVIARQDEPILEPELPWEREGLVDNVVFSCGSVEMDGRYLVYYGGADQYMGVAGIDKADVRFCSEL